jgi:PAS domain S-box-containing protein
LHVGNEGSGALLRRAASVSQEPLTIVSDNTGDVHGDVVVFGPGANEPLARAQAILQAEPTVQILFLVQQETLERFRSTLPFVPHMASAWTADIASAPEAIAGIITKAAQAAARRLSNRTVASRINLQLTQRVARDKAEDAEKWRLEQMTLSEVYLATLLTQAPDAFIALSGAGGIVAWNDAATRLFGVSAEVAVGADVGAVLPPEMESELRELSALASSGQAFTGRQVAFSTSDGAKWVELSVAPVRDARHNVQTLSITVRDVTDRLQADARREALVTLTDRFRYLDEGSDLGFAAAEILGQALGVSRAGYGTIDTAAETISIERDWNAPGIKSLAGVLNFRDYGSYIEDLKRGETVVCGDAEIDPRTQANAAALSAISARSFVNMPVTEQGRFVALLYLNHADARPWPPEELSFIREIAERTRTAVERRRAEAALRANEARLRFLDALGKQAATSGEADAILATTTGMLGEHLKVAICAYADMDPDQDGFTILGDWSAPGSRSIVGHYRLADFGNLAVTSLGAGRPLVVNDNLAELPPQEAAAFQNLGIASTICMPLVKEGRLTALMAIHDKVPRIWTDNELALLSEVTERSWAHIERVRSEAEIRSNERRFREELEAKVAARTAALALSEKSMRTVFETSHQYQGLLTPEGRVVYTNATSLAGIESKLEDVVDRPFWETPWFTGTRGMPEAIRDAVARVAAGETSTGSMALELPTGRHIYDFSMRPVFGEDGKVVAMVPEAVDITARVHAEDALRQAQKMEAVGQLTGGIAHDFNNLLAAITGSLELLERRLADGRLSGVQRYISAAQEGARRAATLTQRLLAFSRRQTLDPPACRCQQVDRRPGGPDPAQRWADG